MSLLNYFNPEVNFDAHPWSTISLTGDKGIKCLNVIGVGQALIIPYLGKTSRWVKYTAFKGVNWRGNFNTLSVGTSRY